MPHYEYNEGTPISAEQLFGEIDDLMHQFLTTEAGLSDGTEHSNEAQADLLNEIFDRRRRFSDLLRCHLPDVEWDSQIPLSSVQLDALCEKITNFTDRYCNEHSTRLTTKANRSQSTMNAVAGSEILGEEQIGQEHMYLLNRFGMWLRRLYLFKSDTASERQAMADMDTLNDVDTILRLVTACSAMQGGSLLGNQLLHSILHFSTSQENWPALTEWMKELETKLCQLSEEDGPPAVERTMAETFRERFPGSWMEHIEHEVVRVVDVGTKESPLVCLLPVENFVFQETIAEASPEDNLPLEGTLHREGCELRDVSLFNHLGEKTYWGDLNSSEIAEIRGPYYVLSQTDSYHRVPNGALLPESSVPASDPNRPRGIPDAEFPPDQRLLRLPYVKAYARGLIHKGRYCENPKTIQWPTGEENNTVR